MAAIREDINAFNDPKDVNGRNLDPRLNMQECWGYALEEYYERCARKNAVEYGEAGNPTETAAQIKDLLIKNGWSIMRTRKDLISAALDEFSEIENEIRDIEAQDALDLTRMAALGAAPGAAADTIMRYETALLRQFYQALHELERRQALRAGQRVIPPAALDISIDMGEKT